MAVGNLITLQKLKTVLGLDPSEPHPDDSKYSTAITTASAVIRAYTGLTLETGSNPASARDFYYNGSGYLDINECHSISDVTTKSGYTLYGDTPRTLTVDEYLAYPLNTTVKMWLQLPQIYGFYGGSPAMGFTRNLDQNPLYLKRPDIITVTAVWGWTTIPDDIQQAAIWTALSIGDSPREQFRSESIESYSRTRGTDSVGGGPIPDRALAILDQYLIPHL